MWIWFLEPKDDNTNQIIARHCLEEDFLSQVVCEDGLRHNLWRCSEALRTALLASKKRLRLKFSVFSSQDSGPIKNVDFLYSARKTRKATK